MRVVTCITPDHSNQLWGKLTTATQPCHTRQTFTISCVDFMSCQRVQSWEKTEMAETQDRQRVKWNVAIPVSHDHALDSLHLAPRLVCRYSEQRGWRRRQETAEHRLHLTLLLPPCADSSLSSLPPAPFCFCERDKKKKERERARDLKVAQKDNVATGWRLQNGWQCSASEWQERRMLRFKGSCLENFLFLLARDCRLWLLWTYNELWCLIDFTWFVI